MAAKKSAVAKRQSTEVALTEEQQELFLPNQDELDAQSYSLPFLRPLQALSDQLKQSSGEYIKGAKQGQIVNTVEKTVHDTIVVAIVKAVTLYVEWIPRNKGGGLVQIYRLGEQPQDAVRDPDTNVDMRPNGNELRRTIQYYVLTPGEERWEAAVISMSSTQLKIAGKINTARRNWKIPKLLTMSTQLESNDKGEWYSWTWAPAGSYHVNDEEFVAAYAALKNALAQERVVINVDQEEASPNDTQSEQW